MQLHHFYHVYTPKHWKAAVDDHLLGLRKGGLLENLTSLHVGFVGEIDERQKVKDYLTEQGIKYEIAAEAIFGWEQVTQIALYKFAQDNEGYVLYAHSKGSWSPTAINHAWRKSMIYFNVVKWRNAIKHLETHDAVGCHFINPIANMPEHEGTSFFAGTFWWSHLSYVRKLGVPAIENRHRAEDWMGSRIPINAVDLCPGWPGFDKFVTNWDDPAITIESL